MAKIYHCWKCGIKVPMLSKKEWQSIHPLLLADTKRMKEFRKENGLGLSDALAQFQSRAGQKHFEMTGINIAHWQAIWHHRLSEFGSECPKCGHLFRSPKARFCANCGFKKETPSDQATLSP